MEAESTGRNVYLPEGQWIDYKTGKVYAGGWHRIEAGKIPVVMLVREGTVIPHIRLAQSTMQMDWTNLDLVVFAADANKAEGRVCLPSDNLLHEISLARKDGAFRLADDPLAKRVAWQVKLYSDLGQ